MTNIILVVGRRGISRGGGGKGCGWVVRCNCLGLRERVMSGTGHVWEDRDNGLHTNWGLS